MKLSNYLKDKAYAFYLLIGGSTFITLMLFAFKVAYPMIISTLFVIIMMFVFLLGIDYTRKKAFYLELLTYVETLDQSYLVLEMLQKPEFYEGKLIYDAMYTINKSMNENVNQIEEQLYDFKDYIEMWIHEVKVPLASLLLIENNHKGIFDRKAKSQIKRLENAVNQVLYYVRSEHAEKDYLIQETDLSKIIKDVGIKNMDDLLENKINFIVEPTNVTVLTDAKWLEFMIDQIIHNSIKYKQDNIDSYIKIAILDDIDKTSIIIEDNGIGIVESDLKRVFEKSFTGENGRKNAKSTGMGLYIAKQLCNKLGHQIDIESKEMEYTKVIITIKKNKFYEVLQ